jgi:hypothetical protein
MAIALVKTLDLVVEPSRVLESCAGFLDVAALETAGRGIERGAEVEEHRLGGPTHCQDRVDREGGWR